MRARARVYVTSQNQLSFSFCRPLKRDRIDTNTLLVELR